MRIFRKAIWLLPAAILLAGVFRLRFDVEILNLLPKNLGVAEGLKLYQRHFSDANELIITLKGSNPEEVELAAGSIARMLRSRSNLVSRVVWQPLWQEYPGQTSDLIAYLWLNQPPGTFRNLVSQFGQTKLSSIFSDARDRLATSLSPNEIALRGYDPLGLMDLPQVSGASQSSLTDERIFASEDGSFRILFVEARPNIIGYRECRTWLREIQQSVLQERKSLGVSDAIEIRYTGRPVFVTEIAGGMESDMAGSCIGTLVVIGILFYLSHRRLRPLFLLIGTLLIVLGFTLAAGGLVFGTINVVSMGFASILAGLAEDFGVVVYQELRSHPQHSLAQLRKIISPGILWSTLTTASAFLMLNLSSLPGLAQLGSLIAIGIVLAAVLMIYGYLPILFHLAKRAEDSNAESPPREKYLLFNSSQLLPPSIIWGITGMALIFAVATLSRIGPLFDSSPDVLKPKNSEAYAALESIKQNLGRNQDPFWILMRGTNQTQVSELINQAESKLEEELKSGTITGYTLPNALWPHPENLRSNCVNAASAIQNWSALEKEALQAGFTKESLVLTSNVFGFWRTACSKEAVQWPTNEVNQWIFRRFMVHAPEGAMALGLVYPSTNSVQTKEFARRLEDRFEETDVVLSGWQLLGTTVFDEVMSELPMLVCAIGLIVLVSLWLAFRNWKEVLLSVASLAFTGICLVSFMIVLQWRWNLLNLMAIPLLLGMGVDFSIHVQLALRRQQGNLLAVRQSVGRALLLAGTTTVVGFVSLAFSQNMGMASLGRVCALGIGIAMIVAIFLLPVWWHAFAWERNKAKE